MNSAALDGKQVSRPLKIFIVSRAGQVADVTLQASCRSLDESVLKVSSVSFNIKELSQFIFRLWKGEC